MPKHTISKPAHTQNLHSIRYIPHCFCNTIQTNRNYSLSLSLSLSLSVTHYQTHTIPLIFHFFTHKLYMQATCICRYGLGGSLPLVSADFLVDFGGLNLRGDERPVTHDLISRLFIFPGENLKWVALFKGDF